MTLLRANLAFALIGCAQLTQLVGCVQPWSQSKGTRPADARWAADKEAVDSLAKATAQGNATGDSSSAEMAGVMDKLAEIREMDPAAEQKLLEQLRKTPPNSWPLVAEQFRASLAYHQQLAAKRPKTEKPAEPMAAFDSLPETSAAKRSQRSPAENEPPSSAIGLLGDPRSANADRYATAAAAPPPTSSSAAPPAEFAASGTVDPITLAPGTPVEPAAFNPSPAENIHLATQALATTPAESPHSRKPLPDNFKNEQANWRQHIHQAIGDLSQRVSSSPTTTAEVHQHVSLRLLRLLAGDTEKALEPIPHIPPAEQDYWSRQIFALATYLDHHSQPDDKRRATASAVHLDEAASHLRDLGSLSLRNLSFCKNVYGYGAFEPYDAEVFNAGQQVAMYVEVENYHSRSGEKGYTTLLGATYEILDDKGKRVSGGDFPDVDDCCRRRRRDFHIQYGLALPESLSPGRYRVELVVKDRQSDKLGHATLPFEISSGKK